MRHAALALLLLIGGAALAAQAATPEPSPAGFREFLTKWEEAQSEFINGNPAPWKRSVSSRGDGTIFGAFGGFESGSQVLPRYDWAASQYVKSGAAKRVEYLSRVVEGRLAVTVAIERDRARVAGRAEPIDQALRVTQVFRWEDGSWKLIHRHADPLLERKPPSRG